MTDLAWLVLPAIAPPGSPQSVLVGFASGLLPYILPVGQIEFWLATHVR